MSCQGEEQASCQQSAVSEAARNGREPSAGEREGVTPRMREQREGVTPRMREQREGVTPRMREQREGVTPRMREQREGVTPRMKVARIDRRRYDISVLDE